MTVIAAFTVRGCPILFGDLLVSGETQKPPPVAVPALGDVREFFGDSGWSVLGLHQKIAIVSDNCAIAWSGQWWVARVADVQQHAMAFVGWVNEDKGLRQFRYQAEAFDGGALGEVYAAGSGSVAMRELAAAVTNMTGVGMTGSPNTGTVAVSVSLSMAGLLLRSEMHGGYAAPTLRALFGGGYEVAWFNGRAFQKVPAVTFVIWVADTTPPDIKLTLPQLILKQQYVDDVLLMRSARVGVDVSQGPHVVDEQGHAILPMYETSTRVTREDLQSISLQSRLLCHCFLVHMPGGEIAIYTRIQQTGTDSEPAMTFESTEQGLRVGFNSKFVAEVADALRKGYLTQ